jgi:predicted DNA-binding transcriptional regulator
MNIEKLKNGNCLLDGLMVRGSYNPGYIGYVYYRVVPRRILQFDRDITITANDGFKFGVQYFNEEGNTL